MNNPFNISDERLKDLLASYETWMKSIPMEAEYPETFKNQSIKIKEEFLNKETLKQLNDDELFSKIYNYSRKLEGKAYRTLPVDVIKESIKELRHNLEYLLSSDDNPAVIAQNIIEGESKIKHFSKAFWSPILQAQFPEVLPNWNNKTEDFLSKLGINVSTYKLSTADKYYKISEAFKYLTNLIPGHDFYTINHLMHYGTAIKEGSDLIAKLQGNSASDPIDNMIRLYKEQIRKTKLEDELYKWELLKKFKGRPDLNATDFLEEMKGIDYKNLMYEMAVAVKNHIAKDLPDGYRDCFKRLFNDDSDLDLRVKEFMDEVLKIYRKLEPKFGHHHDERTIATFLTYHDPDQYTFFKDSFYQKYCKLIGVEARQKGEKYSHYMELITEFRDKYIILDHELLELVKSCMNPNCFDDTNHLILAQDILFQNLEKEGMRGRRYWRIGTTDEDGQYWDEMLSNKIVSIGWSKLGDLSEKNIEARNDIAKLMEGIGYYDNLGLRNRKAGEVLNFYLEMNKGDVVVAQDGQKVIALGIVIDDYIFQSELHFPHTRSVDWKVVNPDNLINQQGLRTTVFEIDDPVVINLIDKFLFGTAIIESNNIDDSSLNTILYGPPGTGKTYQTIDYSVKIAAPEKYKEGDHKKNKVIYEELNREGQIVFTTFHQSMCYEDFIEGIKPKSDESGNLTYSVEDGLFKQLVINAAFEFVGEKSSYASKSLSFSNAYDRLIDEVNEKVGDNIGFTLKLKSGAELEIVEITSGNNFQVQHKNGSRTYTVSRRRLEKLFSELPDLESISNINEEVRNVIGGSNASAYWAVLKKLRSYRGEIQTAGKKYSYEDKAAAVDKLLPEDIIFTGKEKRYVMIIDEINRGNVSQVFGELITLIEEDKRFGKDERLPAKLPYSRSRFFVPPNLYVIGTMNTADRSVEALDTALRRRFCFIEMVPLYDLDGMEKVIADFRVSDLLETINGRIEKLIDRDHRIGQSYFLGLESSDDLMKLFKHKVIPLLQEYFYGNYEKMGLVLGSGFIDKLPDEKVKFARFPADENDFNDKVIYRINEIPLKDKAEFEKALVLLMNN
jgi:5-methylcytosine-specific restriction protein B